MMRTMMVAVAVAAALGAGWADRAAAQETQAPAAPAAAVEAPAVQASQAAPVGATSRFGPSAVGAELLVPAPARTSADERQMVHAPAVRHAPGIALMVVGGALLLGGAIVGGSAGTALMVGGVVVGVIGVYEYLQ